MKIILQNTILVVLFFFLTKISFGQTPANLGAVSPFVLFTSAGPVSNVGISQITGDYGTNVGSSTAFGNVNGQKHDGDPSSIAAAASLNTAYLFLGAQTATTTLGVLMGGGQILTPAVYETLAATTIGGTLILDGLNDPSACFVLKIGGALGVDPGTKIILLNGTQACNVFWKIEGAATFATNATVKGTFICNGAIGLTSGDFLEGRALSIVGAITVSSVTATAPLGCGVPVLTGPAKPSSGAAECFAFLTGVGALTNVGISHIAGHVGTNNGPVTGFNPLFVDSIHSVPDAMTAAGTAAIGTLYTTLAAMQCDINLLAPTQFGNQQVLTPHVYCMGAAAHMTDTIFLDAQGNADGVFVIKVDGAFTSENFVNVVLRGGAKSSNVFWLIEGLITVSNNSNFVGTIVSNNGAITMIASTLDGRAYSTSGAINSTTMEMKLPSIKPSVTFSGTTTFCEGDSVILTASTSSNYLWSTGETTQSISVDTTGLYSVIASNLCGQSDTSDIISVNVNPSSINNIDAAICNGDSIFLAGAFRKIAGIYTDSLTSIQGCDSIINVFLAIRPVFSQTNVTSICNGDSILIAGIYITTPGVYRDTLSSAFGCDSIIITDLSILPVFTNNINAFICNGDSILIAGTYRKIAGLYNDTITSSFGCDSIINTNLTVNPVNITNMNASICNGDSILIAGIYRKIPGIYNDTLSSSFGCDSIINTNLSVNPLIVNNFNATICDGDSILLAGAYRKIAGTYTSIQPSAFGCDSTNNYTLAVNAKPNANAGNDQSMILGQTVTIGSTSEAGNDYSWLPVDGLNMSNQSMVDASPLVNTTYIVTVTNTLTGCINTDTVNVNVVAELEFFNGFSPNGDGLNDFWRIPVLSYYPSNEVQIISRWGNEVWAGKDYDNLDNIWTGTNMKGEDLPDGTYYYIIHYSNFEKRGWVFIKR